MRVFTVHQPADGQASPRKLLPEGFSWWGLWLGPVWLLLHGAWPFALVGICALALLPWAAWPGLFVLAGLCGHDMRRAMLAWRGWRMEGVVIGADSERAELRWFDKRMNAEADGPR